MKSGKSPPTIRSVAIIANGAFSIVNFRGPLIKALIERGAHVYALAPDYDDSTRESVRLLGAEPIAISMERSGMRPISDFLDAVKLARLLRRLAPDLSFAYFAKPVIYGSIAARFAGVPRRFALVAGLGYVFGSEAGASMIRRLRRRALRLLVSTLYRLAFSACERVFFQNEDDVAHFVNAGILPANKALRLNGTGVDLNHFSPEPAVTTPVRFVLVARLLREKGICEFVQAARIVRTHSSTCEFVLLGGLDVSPGGLSRREILNLVDDGIVEWVDQVDDVRPWLARSSVFVLPSYYREGVPRSTQEALAMGRPVITTDSVGCRDTVIDGVNGYLVPTRDANALARTMIRFIEDPSLIGRLGAESRRLAEARFDVHKINTKMLHSFGMECDVDVNVSG